MISQFRTVANQLTLLRLIFIPFVIIDVVDGNYFWAMILFVAAGLSDGLDGLLARKLKQQTVLGEYLDPIADKLLLSSMFLVLSFMDKIPWRFTIVVFTRDVCILMVSAVLYIAVGLRNFRPSIFGKMNTFAQVSAVFFTLLLELRPDSVIYYIKSGFLWAVFALTCVSAVHYIVLVGYRIKALGEARDEKQMSRPAAS
ncbi:MAG TPA: CDP-alcohol phosphatidyltransferase family protein [Terriglobales bacterium]|nr:CDP-alcohol phosphatidyltransferase family protein [Terriglobales bacterium]